MTTRRPRRIYTDEFKQQLVLFYLNGKRKCDIVREYDIAAPLLDKGIRQYKQSLSIKGYPYDNKIAGATYKIIKIEFIKQRRFSSL